MNPNHSTLQPAPGLRHSSSDSHAVLAAEIAHLHEQKKRAREALEELLIGYERMYAEAMYFAKGDRDACLRIAMDASGILSTGKARTLIAELND